MPLWSRTRTASLTATVILLAATVTPLAAQDTAIIRGTVVEAGSRAPIGDAQVIVEGTRLGAVTNSAGVYTITGVPAGTHTMRARSSATTLSPNR